MSQINKDIKRKFLKTIYEIQKSFGSDFGNVSRNFSFGIKPTEDIQKKLEIWFSQVNEAKTQLYLEIFAAYKQKPHAYLGASFDYGTFFRGGTSFGRLKINRNLITSVPVIEGLRMEINGSIRSFITNHKRKFEENISDIARLKKIVSENKASLQTITLDTENALIEHLEKLEGQSYEDVIFSYDSLQAYENLLLAFNESVADYNYEANQLNSSQKLNLSVLDKLSRLPAFPGVNEKEQYEIEGIFKRLTELASKEMERSAIIAFLEKANKRIERKTQGKRKRFEDRLSAYLYKKYSADFSNQEKVVHEFTASLDNQITKLKEHFDRKHYDGVSRIQPLCTESA